METDGTIQTGVILPLFIKLQIANSIVLNEVAVMQVNVSKYVDQDHNVSVTLKGSDVFASITVVGNSTIAEVTKNVSKCILVKKNQTTEVYFNVQPLKVGNLSLSVRAEISQATAMFDEARRILDVKAQGWGKENTISFGVYLGENSRAVAERDLKYPPEKVPGSERTRVSVTGNVFGPSLEKIEKIFIIPYGGGEENMIFFAPAVSAAAYLKRTKALKNAKDLQSRIEKVIETGYQRQMRFKRHDGSFSANGKGDDAGSTWLTAYVAKSFVQADVVYENPDVVDVVDVVEEAVTFIISHQNLDGTINNVGTIFHDSLTGGTTQSKNSFMAYVLTALQEVKQSGILMSPTISQALDESLVKLTDALLLKIPEMTTDYERAIGAYALNLVNNKAHTTLLNELENSPNIRKEGNKTYWFNPSKWLQIEIASYALSIYSSIGDTEKGLRVYTWLVESMDPFNEYMASQGLVVGFQAFAEFIPLVETKNVSMTVDIYTRTGGAEGNRKQIMLTNGSNDSNSLQYAEFVGKVDQVVLGMEGTGVATIIVNQLYTVASVDGRMFELNVTTSDETSGTYTVTACARCDIPYLWLNKAVMDIDAVSGFTPMKDQVIPIPLMNGMEVSDQRLVIYYDQIPETDVCVSVPMQRVALVASVAPASVRAYLYHDPTEMTMKSYLPGILSEEQTSLCKTCHNVCCNTDNMLARQAC